MNCNLAFSDLSFSSAILELQHGDLLFVSFVVPASCEEFVESFFLSVGSSLRIDFDLFVISAVDEIFAIATVNTPVTSGID